MPARVDPDLAGTYDRPMPNHRTNPSLSMDISDAEVILRVSDVTVRFQSIVALDGLSFEVTRGQIAGLIGPNGAGKTTLFNCLSGLYPVEQGEIFFDGAPLANQPSHRIARLGVGRTFQNLALFESMSVFDNVRAGRHARLDSGFLANAFRLGSVQREEAETTSHVHELIAMMQLDDVAGEPVSTLSFATRKRVELAKALASEPQLLLLDEPAGGLNHAEVLAFEQLLRGIRDTFDLTVLLVEHNMSLVKGLCDHVVALDAGRKIAQGTADAVRRHPDVVQAYLGMAA
jgi:branched-chain amino acid transport system ATP-binding protein